MLLMNTNRYKVRFKIENKITNLLLVYNIDKRFQFVNLDTGRIMNLVFEDISEAEEWLRNTAEVFND